MYYKNKKRETTESALSRRKCHCGSLEAIEAPRSAPDSRCSTACPGQPGSKCGGPGHYSVYTTGIVGDETAGKGLGCFNNTPDSFRTTEEFYLWTQNSPKDCIYECMKLGNAFAAVRKSVCKCGNWWPKNLNAEDSCSSRCPLSWYQSCGHEDFIGVYRTGLDSQIGVISHAILSFRQKDITTGGSEPFVSTTAEQPSYKKIGDKMEKILFEDNFNSLDLDKWQKTVRISGETLTSVCATQDNEFTVYSGDKENVFVKDGVLVIVPTVEEEDDFVARGSLDLRDCTGKRGTAQCRFQAMFSHVLPPTKSGQLCTKKSFKFKYGRVTIRAKLPIGDWILPQLWLKSSEEEYGEGYMSGKVVIASVAGNRNLTTQSGEDVGWKVLETGVVASSGPDHPSRSSVVFIKSDEPWQNDFHDFTVLWTPKRMVFYTDGDEKNAKTIYDTRIRSVVEYLGFNKSDDTWAGGSKSAPFDKEFHICLGVGVGGFQGFLDGVLSNGKQKPWSNFEVKSRLKFWRARDDWKPTWSDRSRLEVDSVIVTRE
ncbi:hypothetical protein AAG570_003381 [Ranatra chinensis]|uniref:Uncharacterized protein n=1 Tax=Ranatra chinensis TaxID=642074 RepID=A0ABD0YQ81_9HEMI